MLRGLRAAGKLSYWGVSVETVEEALLSIEQPDCVSVQIIYNALRLKPAEVFFPAAAAAANVAVIVRLPLASGLLAKGVAIKEHISALPPTDHRVFNVSGAAFDKGESLSGLGEHLEGAVYPAVGELAAIVPTGTPMAAFYLRFALQHPAVSVVIPGMRTTKQVAENISACLLPPLSVEEETTITRVYGQYIGPLVHSSW